jgi:hypothetical protein
LLECISGCNLKHSSFASQTSADRHFGTKTHLAFSTLRLQDEDTSNGETTLIMNSLTRGKKWKLSNDVASPRRTRVAKTQLDHEPVQTEDPEELYISSLRDIVQRDSNQGSLPMKSKSKPFHLWHWKHWTEYKRTGNIPSDARSKHIFCVPCNTEIAHKGVLQAHTNGKVHLANAKIEYKRCVGLQQKRSRPIGKTHNNINRNFKKARHATATGPIGKQTSTSGRMRIKRANSPSPKPSSKKRGYSTRAENTIAYNTSTSSNASGHTGGGARSRYPKNWTIFECSACATQQGCPIGIMYHVCGHCSAGQYPPAKSTHPSWSSSSSSSSPLRKGNEELLGPAPIAEKARAPIMSTRKCAGDLLTRTYS